jgi:hypothetical protein
LRRVLLDKIECASYLRIDTQYTKKIWRDARPCNSLRFSRPGAVQAHVFKSGNALEDVLLSHPLLEIDICSRDAVADLCAEREIPFPYQHQAIGFAIRQGSQQYRIYYAEYRRIGANPERENKDDDGRKYGGFANQTQPKSQMLKKRIHFPTLSRRARLIGAAL